MLVEASTQYISITPNTYIDLAKGSINTFLPDTEQPDPMQLHGRMFMESFQLTSNGFGISPVTFKTETSGSMVFDEALTGPILQSFSTEAKPLPVEPKPTAVAESILGSVRLYYRLSADDVRMLTLGRDREGWYFAGKHIVREGELEKKRTLFEAVSALEPVS